MSEQDITNLLTGLRYDTCDKHDSCEPCKGLRQDSIAAIESLQQTVAELQSDIDRHITIASQLATEVEGLRAERLITRDVFDKALEKLGERLPAVRLLLEQSRKHQSAKFDNWAPHLQADAYRRLGVEPVVMYRRALASPPAAEDKT